MSRAATTEWIEYDAKSMFAPRESEWCLWAVTMKGVTNCFGGMIYEKSVYADHWGAFEINKCDRLLWARVRMPEPIENE